MAMMVKNLRRQVFVVSEEKIDAIWEKGRIVPGYDPSKFRKDACGAWIARDKYGDADADFGWEIDHIYPQALGGGDDDENKRPLHCKNNRSKGDDYPSYKSAVTARGNKNVEQDRILFVNKKKMDVLNSKYGVPNA